MVIKRYHNPIWTSVYLDHISALDKEQVSIDELTGQVRERSRIVELYSLQKVLKLTLEIIIMMIVVMVKMTLMALIMR